jgi:hypothetical protein
MKLISRETRAQAWLDAANALCAADTRIYNLILEITSPASSTRSCELIERTVDQFLRANDCQPLNTVAETIFPGAEYRQRGIEGVYEYPDSIYPSIKSASPWGNYALRLTRRETADELRTLNPLQLLIEKGKRQLATGAPKYASYELDLNLNEAELALYNAEFDHHRVIGGQCLSHISVKLGPRPEYSVYLTAVYRYQYFAQKALGNLLGLARLQACIAREWGVPIGPLVCHATLGVLEDKRMEGKLSWSHKDLEAMLNHCNSHE